LNKCNGIYYIIKTTNNQRKRFVTKKVMKNQRCRLISITGSLIYRSKQHVPHTIGFLPWSTWTHKRSPIQLCICLNRHAEAHTHSSNEIAIANSYIQSSTLRCPPASESVIVRARDDACPPELAIIHASPPRPRLLPQRRRFFVWLFGDHVHQQLCL
jgi:hypothetical protein